MVLFFERALNFSNLQTFKQEDILYSCNCRLLWINNHNYYLVGTLKEGNPCLKKQQILRD